MSLLALVVAAHTAAVGAGAAAQLPPAPLRLWNVAWKQTLVPPGGGEVRPQEMGGPAIDPAGQLIVVGTRDGWVHARDAEGARRWDFQTGGRIDGAPRIDGDAVYVGSADGKLYALDLRTGKQRWSYDAHEEVGTTPAVAGGLVLAMTLQDTLIAVDAATGAWKWHHRREGREGFSIHGAAPAMVSGGTVLGGYSDGTVAAVDLASGTVRWERTVAPTGDFMDVDGLALDGDRLYAAAYSGAVLAIDVATGQQVWSAKLPGAARVGRVGGVLLAATPSQLVGLEPATGKTRWTLPIQGAPSAPPALVGARALVPDGNGLLFLDAARGVLLRVFNPGTGVSASPAGSGDRLYVLSNAGDLFALDLS